MSQNVYPILTDSVSSDTASQALDDIATDLADLIRGYEEMTDRADGDLQPIVQRLLVLHQTHATEVYEELNRRGGDADQVGSVMGLVHTAVATARDWFDDLDASALDAIADGEEQIIKHYNEAIEKAPEDDAARDLLRRQRDDLREQVKALRS